MHEHSKVLTSGSYHCKTIMPSASNNTWTSPRDNSKRGSLDIEETRAKSMQSNDYNILRNISSAL